MNLKNHYNNLYRESIQKISNNDYQIDNLIDSPRDKRFGITLIIRPTFEVKNKIQEFLNKLKAIEPNQYYYKNSDIHITVMSIISCYHGFQLKNIDILEYVKLINQSLDYNSNLEINFKGITASPSCLMIQGFMNHESLNIIRNNLREKFKNTTLQQSIDKRYPIQTAHSTVFRFKEKLNQKAQFLKSVEDFRNYDFGSFKVGNLELVYNDWYQKEKHVKKLFDFSI